MESSRQLDAVGRATTQRPGIVALTLFLVAVCATPGLGQASSVDQISRVKSLFDQQLWEQVVEATGGPSADSAELNYYYGSAAGQLGEWDEARAAFLAGARLTPRDPRFPVELGGVAFRRKRYAEAAKWLRRGLRLNPDDSYANEFLASVYFLNGNLEAALKYWNRIGQPQIEAIRWGTLRVNRELLDRAFVFAPASVMQLSDYLTTRQRVEGLGIFSMQDFHLAGRDDGKFDVDFQARERNGMGDSKLLAVVSTFRGILWSTAYPEYYNIRHSAMNLHSMVRWDAQKRRLFASFSGPVRRNPKYRLQIGTDLRNENWVLVEPLAADLIFGAFNTRREAADASFTSFASGQWTWSTGAELSHRDYRNVSAGPVLSQQVLLSGYQLKHLAQLSYGGLRIPERRIATTLTVSSQFGSIWSSPSHTFEKLQGELLARWLPKMAGEDHATELHVRYGRTFGDVPLDELYMLGLERDTPLGMRAHRGTRDGRKGSAPLGRNYFLANIETDKIVYQRGLIGITLSPFLDVGKVWDPIPALGSKRWLFDTGIEAKVHVWGIGFAMTYGKDLRSGANAFLLSAR